jgi:hypothetical protein
LAIELKDDGLPGVLFAFLREEPRIAATSSGMEILRLIEAA